MTGAPLVPVLAAIGLVYVCGYVTGANVLKPIHDRTSLALAGVRLMAGLFLSSLVFLWALLFSLPWWVGPAVVAVAAMLRSGPSALEPPCIPVRVSPGGVVAALGAALLLAPAAVSTARMAPGEFPPLFLNVDVPYFLEKVHALVQAHSYPPESLSVLGGSRPYHFGLHGVAALVARGSGLAPHHAVFGVLVPIILLGLLSASTWAARSVASHVTPALTVPFLLVGVPTLWYDTWLNAVPRLGDALASASLGPLEALAKNWEMWGVTANIQNLCAHALVLAAVAAWVRAPTIGWELACFLVGSAFAFKSPTGIALLAGLGLAQLWRVAGVRSLRPMLAVGGAAAVFAVVYGTLWVWLPLPAELRVVVQPLFQIEYVEGHGGLAYFAWDVAWLVLPAVLVWLLARRATGGHDAALLPFALGPFVAVNVFRLQDLRREYGVSSMNEDDWRQVIMAMPILLHVLALAVVGGRWARLVPAARLVVGAAFVAAVAPPAYVAYAYAGLIAERPAEGHEFADNRALGEALATVPVGGSVLVTNDLRYPADGFRREDRQMQIPALFGHQAFAANYFYESYPFSPERRRLQALLSQSTWAAEIDDAARTHGWTHLIIHKGFAHPDPVPLERLSDNAAYTVYRFPR